ncbi:hypothetical protein Lal_00011252 [Lupinus albus]|nr:hypothetical protein Lal_00011252 [Lupinus albus]
MLCWMSGYTKQDMIRNNECCREIVGVVPIVVRKCVEKTNKSSVRKVYQMEASQFLEEDETKKNHRRNN